MTNCTKTEFEAEIRKILETTSPNQYFPKVNRNGGPLAGNQRIVATG